MYVNPNSPVKLHLDLQLAKNKYVYHRILCNSKDNIMLTFLFFCDLRQYLSTGYRRTKWIFQSRMRPYSRRMQTRCAQRFVKLKFRLRLAISNFCSFVLKLTSKQTLDLEQDQTYPV